MLKVISAIGDPMGIKAYSAIGGTSVRDDVSTLKGKVHVVVGTPGRVLDLIGYEISIYLDFVLILFQERRIERSSVENLDLG